MAKTKKIKSEQYAQEPTPVEVEAACEAFKIARVKFVDTMPFYALLLLDLDVQATGTEIPTAAVNYKNLYINAIGKANNPECMAFQELTTEGQRTVLAHEILHLVFEHCGIGSNMFDHNLANIAMDSVINRILDVDTNFSLKDLPPGIVTPIKDYSQYVGFTIGEGKEQQTFKIDDFANKDWIQIYWDMMKQLEKKHGAGNREAICEACAALGELNPMNGDMPDNTKDAESANSDNNKFKFRQRVIAAVEEAQKSQGYVPGEVARLAGQLQEAKVKWTDHLRHLIRSHLANDDFSWKSNSRRAHLGREGRPAFFPKVESEALGDIYLVLDTSGSMGDREIREGLSEFRGIRQVTPFNLHFIATDAMVYEVESYDRNEEPEWGALRIHGGGGTDFTPAFNIIDEKMHQENLKPDLVVYFTDGYGTFPQHEPEYPVIWVSTHSDKSHYPWGKVVLMEDK